MAGDISTKFEIKGNATDLKLYARSAKAITVKGALSNADIRTLGTISAVAVGSIAGSTVFAGVRPGITAFPSTAADFDSVAAAITKFSITSSPPVGTSTFSDSRVAAAVLGSVSVKGLTPLNSGSDFGFAAFSVASYARTGLTAIKNPVAGEYDRQTDYVLRVISGTE
jgi:hypothetical protein